MHFSLSIWIQAQIGYRRPLVFLDLPLAVTGNAHFDALANVLAVAVLNRDMIPRRDVSIFLLTMELICDSKL